MTSQPQGKLNLKSKLQSFRGELKSSRSHSHSHSNRTDNLTGSKSANTSPLLWQASQFSNSVTDLSPRSPTAMQRTRSLSNSLIRIHSHRSKTTKPVYDEVYLGKTTAFDYAYIGMDHDHDHYRKQTQDFASGDHHDHHHHHHDHDQDHECRHHHDDQFHFHEETIIPPLPDIHDFNSVCSTTTHSKNSSICSDDHFKHGHARRYGSRRGYGDIDDDDDDVDEMLAHRILSAVSKSDISWDI
ncbi:uncharacterized protein LODBEIA_P42030 [Lodderomyces beijingensis]|uniref:Uncharacterized protein n=1 Tax=Lodderomyces beijingensis TaxID=1775926 RepID=A0ABP0ZPY9_9ASCO